MVAVGSAKGTGCELPLTQSDLADALGMSKAHLNRTLQDLRARKLIGFGDKRLMILDLLRLEGLGLFESSYLQLDTKYTDRREA